jgi:GTPase SAR1 family protein
MEKPSSEAERIKNTKLLEDTLALESGKVLITGVGISGKSTFRRALFQYLKDNGKPVAHYDADNFSKIRHPLDEFCLNKLPENFDDKLYLIEDIHATMPKGAIMPISSYDNTFYVLPDIKSHNMFWGERMLRWFENGTFSWEAGSGWSGTGKPRDPENLKGIMDAYQHDMDNRENWIKEDLDVISKYPHKIVKSVWTKEGPVFV